MAEARGSAAARRLATRLELERLAHQLDLGADELAFLADTPAERLRQLRTDISERLYARHEARFRRVASLATAVPIGIAARAAELAVGPVVSARIAGSVPTADAVRFAERLPIPFLAEVAIWLEPSRGAPIIARLDAERVVAVGRVLLEREEHLVLARFVSIVPADVALQVVDGAAPAALLRIALFAEDRTALSDLVRLLDAAVVRDVVRDALAEGETAATATDAVTLLAALDADARGRVVQLAAGLPPRDQHALVEAVVEADAWSEVLPALTALDETALRLLVNAPATADAAVLDQVIEAAREADAGPALVRVLLLLDDERVAALRGAAALRRGVVQSWLRERSGVAPTLVDALLEGLGAR